MSVSAKICGLNTPETVAAAVAGGAGAIGLMFYEPSPRYISIETAAELGREAGGAKKVGVFVDPDDAVLDRSVSAAGLDMIQLHGRETPERIHGIKARFGLPVMKAVRIAGPEDLGAAKAYEGVADWLLFDAKAPTNMAGALPGGNGMPFDWRILAARSWQGPWMLSGGLSVDNVAEAVSISGAPWVDVSSGVEDAPGRKSVARIAAFLDTVRQL